MQDLVQSVWGAPRRPLQWGRDSNTGLIGEDPLCWNAVTISSSLSLLRENVFKHGAGGGVESCYLISLSPSSTEFPVSVHSLKQVCRVSLSGESSELRRVEKAADSASSHLTDRGCA